MTIKTQITLRDFFIFHLKSSIIRMIIYPLIFLAILFINLYDAEDDSKEYLNLIFIFVSLLFIFIIIRTYFSLKNAFISNKKIQETIYYTFTNESISTKGETFDADFT